MFHAGLGEVPLPCFGFCGQQGTCTVAMRCTSGPKGREQVYSTSYSNGMYVKFSMLASIKQAVRNHVVCCPVPQCRDVWQWRLNMANHKSSDDVHMQFPYSPEGLEAWTVGDEEKAIFKFGERAWRSSKKGDKRKPEAKDKVNAFRHQMRADAKTSKEKGRRKGQKRALRQGAEQGEKVAHAWDDEDSDCARPGVGR